MIADLAIWFRSLQQRITDALERTDGEGRFREDPWERPGGGGGRTRVLEGGAVFEKAGVNWSDVHGDVAPLMRDAMPGTRPTFRATGTSLVLHPRSPRIPTVHMNVRAISRGDATWVGGGMDLTPYYPTEDDARHFHRVCKAACDRVDRSLHSGFKRWCDAYFHLPHRGEARGIGGVFFDWVGLSRAELPSRVQATSSFALESALPREQAVALVQSVGDAFLDAYLPIVERHRDAPWGERERDFQSHRRGRYVEFNLVYDRGTHFGLHTGGRTESILMSLPPLVRWTYDYQPEPGSEEARLLDFLQPRDWV